VNGSASSNGNGHHPAPSQPAQVRKGWRVRRGSNPADASGQQKLLPKPDDTAPAALERRLSRAGLLKGVAAGAAGLAAVETANTIDAPHAAAASGQLEYHSFVAADGTVTLRPDIAFRTEGTGYVFGGYLKGTNAGVVGQGIRPAGTTQGGTGVYGKSVTDLGGATLSTGIGVWGDSGAGIGVKGVTYNTRRLTPSVEVGGTGVLGESNGGSGVSGQSGVIGYVSSAAQGKPGIGVLGFDTANTGIGVAGISFTDISQQSWGAGTGVLGRGHVGVKGEAFTNDGYAVQGSNKGFLGTAIYGESLTPQGQPGHGSGIYGHTGDGIGVFGRAVADGGVGVSGVSLTDAGVAGESGTGAGVFGITTGNTGIGVEGRSYATPGRGAFGNGTGVKGTSNSIGVEGDGYYGVKGVSTGFFGAGVFGTSSASLGYGIFGNSVDSQGNPGSGIGVLGSSGAGPGVKGTATGSGTGVWGEGGVGIRGISNGSQLTGVYGVNTTNDGVGVAGRSYADSGQGALGAGFGVWGDSGSGIGVKGSASTGRGGVFSGGAAQLQLVPSSQQSPPTSGQTGDLFLDSTAKLWLCTAGGANAVWVTMGSGGGGGSNGGPIVAHSGVIATPGVYGDNNTNDPTSIGISGASVDGNGQPGAGIGVKGASGTGAGVLGTSSGPMPMACMASPREPTARVSSAKGRTA
jgi:hypothetical protein